MPCQAENKIVDSQFPGMVTDDIGLHRVENPSFTDKAVSLHLYSPPFTECASFDQRTGHKNMCKVTFYSRAGKRTPFGKWQKQPTVTFHPADLVSCNPVVFGTDTSSIQNIWSHLYTFVHIMSSICLLPSFLPKANRTRRKWCRGNKCANCFWQKQLHYIIGRNTWNQELEAVCDRALARALPHIAVE